jgi:hypothetical protein
MISGSFQPQLRPQLAVRTASPKRVSGINTTPERAASPRRVLNDSPFRNVFQNHSVHSREGRLANLVRDYTEKVLGATRRTVDAIITKADRSRYLSEEDRLTLVHAAERHLRFMANAEAALQAAVDDNAPMERATVERCHDRWRDADDAVTRIERVTQLYGPGGVQAPPRARPAPPMPPSLPGINDIPRRRPASPAGRSVSRVESRSLPQAFTEPALAQLESKKFISAEEAREAQAVFVRHLGPVDGKQQFLMWLSRLPVEALRSLQHQLPRRTN